MIKFILNNKETTTDKPAGMTLLDFLRYHKHLTGTKIGCREGDCGACTILIGSLKNNELIYNSFTSCLTPLANVHEKHVVTIEGINMADLNPIQQAMADEGGTQCGFCTSGFVMSLAGFCLSQKTPDYESAIAAIDGNICRCTGYKSIERAAMRITQIMKKRNGRGPVDFVVSENILPEYFSTIKSRLHGIAIGGDGQFSIKNKAPQFVGGGTDLYVQKHDQMIGSTNSFTFNDQELRGIMKNENKCILGGATTVAELAGSPIINEFFPEFRKYQKLVSSTPIRNMATLAGNFVNASPIGDFTIFFLALNAKLILSNGKTFREIFLKNLYKGYKELNKKPDEYVEKIWFELPDKDTYFNFEKVSKRTHLDIASVNTAISIKIKDNQVIETNLSAGGVGPIPMCLEKTAMLLKGKTLNEQVIKEVLEMAQTEISPISDARGTEIYKRLLLNQLLKAHFNRMNYVIN